MGFPTDDFGISLWSRFEISDVRDKIKNKTWANRTFVNKFTFYFNQCGFAIAKGTSHNNSAFSLASSSDSEDGGPCPPPLKKLRLAGTMHTNGCPQQNGDINTGGNMPSTSHMNGSHGPSANGDIYPESRQTSFSSMSQTDQDIIRLIGQHLRGLGLQCV